MIIITVTFVKIIPPTKITPFQWVLSIMMVLSLFQVALSIMIIIDLSFQFQPIQLILSMDINHPNNASDNNYFVDQNDRFNQQNSIRNRDQQLIYIISLLQNIQNIVNQLLNNHNN